MSTPKGWPTQEKDAGLAQEFATIEPIREKQHGLSVLAHSFVFQVGTDAVEANSTTMMIVATAHAAKKGDVIRFTSGALSGQEVKVVDVETNAIYLGEVLASAPVAAVTFEILRHKYPVVDANGNLTTSSVSGPIKIRKDGSEVEVNKDTVTASNTIPMPVEIVAASGTPINITAGDIHVQLSHTGANPDSTQIGDGTNLLGITASNEAKVLDATTHTKLDTLNAKDFATQTTLAALLTELQLKADLTETQPVSAASLPLPTGAATEATLSSLNGKVTAVDTGNVTVSSSALPTGASTLAEQQTQTTHLSDIKTSVQLIDNVITAANTIKGRAKVNLIRNAYGSTPVTTGAYVQLVASTAAEINELDVFDSSGETLVFAVGAAASEVDQFYICPGGNGKISLNIPSGSRLSVKAVSANATVGELLINCLS